MDGWLKTWKDAQGFARVRQAWLDHAGPIGEPLTVHTAQGIAAGRFAGLDEGGALLVAGSDGTERRFNYGDVMIGEPESSAAEQKKEGR